MKIIIIILCMLIYLEMNSSNKDGATKDTITKENHQVTINVNIDESAQLQRPDTLNVIDDAEKTKTGKDREVVDEAKTKQNIDHHTLAPLAANLNTIANPLSDQTLNILGEGEIKYVNGERSPKKDHPDPLLDLVVAVEKVIKSAGKLGCTVLYQFLETSATQPHVKPTEISLVKLIVMKYCQSVTATTTSPPSQMQADYIIVLINTTFSGNLNFT